jgi:hypothetical protein
MIGNVVMDRIIYTMDSSVGEGGWKNGSRER